LIIFDSVATVPARANQVKNFTLFQEDLKHNALPQWFFMTPNMSEEFIVHKSTTFSTLLILINFQRTMAMTQTLHFLQSGQSTS